MVQTTNIHRPFHLQLLPIQAAPQHVLNLEILEYTHGLQTLYQQNLISLGAGTELTEICDVKDVTIAILEGEGSLTLNEEVISLVGFVFYNVTMRQWCLYGKISCLLLIFKMKLSSIRY